MLTKLSRLHREYILKRVAAFETNSATIAEELGSKEKAQLYGFKPVKITYQRIHAIIKKLDPQVVAKQQAIFLSDFSDCPLAFKKNRMIELSNMYRKLLKVKGHKVMTLRNDILKQIKAESGEDVEKLAAAIREAKPYSTTLNIIGDLSGNDKLDRDLSAILSGTGERNRFSDN